MTIDPRNFLGIAILGFSMTSWAQGGATVGDPGTASQSYESSLSTAAKERGEATQAFDQAGRDSADASALRRAASDASSAGRLSDASSLNNQATDKGQSVEANITKGQEANGRADAAVSKAIDTTEGIDRSSATTASSGGAAP